MPRRRAAIKCSAATLARKSPARGLGALRELSAILELRYRLHLVRGEKDEALRALEEAVAVTRDVGDLARTAELMSSEAEDYLLVDSQRSVALRVEASSTLRGLSDRMRLHKLLLGQAFDEFRRGSVPVARERWAEAKHELDAVGEPVTPYTWLAAAWMELFAGNASAARERYGRARQTGPRNLWVTTSDLFSFLSTYDDPTLFEEQYLSVLELALLQVEDRASEARALALALKHRGEEANQPRNVAYAERALCNLECEDGEGRISDRCLELLEAFPADKSQCFLEIGQPAAAVRTAEPALQKEPSDPLLRASLEAAEALLGRTGGLAELEALSTSLRERGSVARALRVEYLLGRVEVGLHSPGGARRLRAVAKAGRAGGFVRLARRAEEAADTRPRREQAPPHP